MMRKCLGSLLALSFVFLYNPPAWAQKGKSYSSGSSSSKSTSGSSSSSSKSTSGSSGKSYSAGSNSGKSSSSSGNSGKSYSSGSSPAGKSYSSSSTDKPSSSGWNSSLTDSGKREESKKKYEQKTKPAETPKSTYRTPKGEEKPIKADSPQVKTVRKYVTHERYVTYDNRASGFYGSYYGQPQPFNDFFSPFLMGWLLSDALNSHQRAAWVHNHRDSMDDARYNELLKRDAKLQAELDALKGQPRDPGYVPDQMKDNPDLMYDKDFVTSAYNPQPESSGVGRFFFWLFIVLLGLFVIGAIGYFLFLREY